MSESGLRPVSADSHILGCDAHHPLRVFEDARHIEETPDLCTSIHEDLWGHTATYKSRLGRQGTLGSTKVTHCKARQRPALAS